MAHHSDGLDGLDNSHPRRREGSPTPPVPEPLSGAPTMAPAAGALLGHEASLGDPELVGSQRALSV